MRNIVRLLTTLVMTVTLSGFGAIVGPAAFAASPAQSNQHHIKISEVLRNLRTRPAGLASWFCNRDVTFQSTVNHLYVSAELGYTGGNYAMLRARASEIGMWEQFQ